MLRRILPLSLLMAALASSSTFAQLPSAALNSVFPPGAKQGTTLDVAVAGANLDDGTQLVFSHPGITAQPKMTEPDDFHPTPTKIPDQFSVTIAADVPAGMYEVRHVGLYGASNPRSFVVGTLNEVLDVGGNQKQETAPEVPEASTITGRTDASNIDYYALNLKAGERILIDTLAQRIDSKANATLVLYGPNERELARSLDVEGLDPVLDFTPPADGKYVLGVYDFTYAGGPDYFYRVNITNTPHIDFIFPPSGPAGSNNQYTLYGRNLPGGQPAEGLSVRGQPLQKLVVNIPIPGDEFARTQAALVGAALPHTMMVDSVEYKLASPQGTSNAVAVGIAQGPVVVEVEPNASTTPQIITVPCEYVGQFYPQRDQDWVQFEAKKGEVYWIEVIGHRLGMNCDPSFLVQRVTKNEQGEEVVADVAAADDAPDRAARMGSDFDTSSDDPSYKLTVPDDGVYRIGVRDNFGDGRSDPRYTYRLVIRHPEPDFRVAVFPDMPATPQTQNIASMETLLLRKGGTTMLKVIAERHDEFDGEITVSVEGLPGGVTSSSAILGGNVTTASLVITSTDTAAAWMGPIKVVAKATLNGQEKVRPARTGTVVWGTQNRQQNPPTYRATRDLVLCVIDQEPARALLEIGAGTLVETAVGGKIELPVKVTRRGELKDPLQLVAVNLPNEIKPKDITINNDQNEGKFELELNNQNIKPGVYTFCMRADSKINYARNPESLTAAEAEKKRLEELVAQMTEQLNTNTAARDVATKTAADAKTVATQAEQLKNQAAQEAASKQGDEKVAADAKLAEAEKALVDAQAALTTAEEAKVKADAEVAALDAKVKTGNTLKQQFDQKLNAIKQAAQPKDIGVSFVTTPVTLRIHASPIAVEVPAPPVGKPEQKMEISVNIVRSYGFNEAVEVTLDPPAGVPGLQQVKGTVAAGETAGKIELTPQKNAPPGDHLFQVKAKGKFGNVNFESTSQTTLKLEP